MKKIIKISLAFILLFLAYKLMLPWNQFPFEHFEYNVFKILPLSWKSISIISRSLIGFVIVIGFFLILENKKVKWLKYLSVLGFSIPFIINPVFPKDWKDNSLTSSETLEINSNFIGNKDQVLVAYLTDQCMYCREAALKLNVARNKTDNFPEVLVVSDSRSINQYFEQQNLTYNLDTISFKKMLQISNSSMPHFQLVRKGLVVKEWNNIAFNYEVLDQLSKNYKD